MDRIRGGEFPRVAGGTHAPMLLIVCMFIPGCGNDETHPVMSETKSVSSQKSDDDYVTSTVCRQCHQKQHDSWHASYHRTMTQEATPATIQGSFDGEPLTVNGYPCRPFRHDNRFFMTLVHPVWDEQELSAGRDPVKARRPPEITYAVDRVIGSHNQQVYLSRSADGSFHTLPLVWHIHRKRWITRATSFLSHTKGGLYEKTKLWNNGCIFCHNTGPQPGLQQTSTPGGIRHTWESRVAELGIACEACHGPGREHVQQRRALAGSALSSSKPQHEQWIVNPSSLPKEQAVLTCARCHGKMIARKEFDRQCLVEGDFFQVGRWNFVDRYDHPSHDSNAAFDEQREGAYFWSDGTPRTTALEYQGLLLSPCYQRGNMTCFSCHSMHDSDPDDQLRFGDADITHQNRACTQCHQSFSEATQLSEHTRHASSSAGSLCYNCHMPFQAYSLMKRVRSHRITSPTAGETLKFGVPNACNQCHVDRSLEWTNEALATWQQKSAEPLNSRLALGSSTVRHALSGHALQRALAVEQLGSDDNFELAGVNWRGRVLIESLEDEYAAVRLLAYQALQKMPSFGDFEYDYIGTEEIRQTQVAAARQRWNSAETSSARLRMHVILNGGLDAELDRLIEDLIKQRNTVPIGILE